MGTHEGGPPPAQDGRNPESRVESTKRDELIVMWLRNQLAIERRLQTAEGVRLTQPSKVEAAVARCELLLKQERLVLGDVLNAYGVTDSALPDINNLYNALGALETYLQSEVVSISQAIEKARACREAFQAALRSFGEADQRIADYEHLSTLPFHPTINAQELQAETTMP